MIRKLPIIAAVLTLFARTAGAGALHNFLNLAMSPDGRHVASVEGDEKPAGGDVVRALVIRDTATGQAVTVTLPCGVQPDCAPGAAAWSPDGRYLAFPLRSPGSHARSVYRVDQDGGGLMRLATFNGTVLGLRYAPGGQLAALAIAGADREAGAWQAGGTDTGVIGGDPRPQRIALVEDGTLAWASPPDLSVYEYDWLPDGSGFVGTAATGDADAHWWTARLFAFDAHTAGAKLLYAPTDRREQLAYPTVSPDGTRIAFVAGLMSDFATPGGEAFVMPRGGGAPVRVGGQLKGTVTSLIWSCTPGRLLAGLLAGPRSALAEIDPSDGSADLLWSAESTIAATNGAVSVGCGAHASATILQSFTDPPELAVGAVGAWHRLTRANEGNASPVHAVAVDWTDDGLAEQGWLLLPPTPAPGVKLPLITIVHGGPAFAYMPSHLTPGFDRALLDHGFALFLPNPRGSFGQSEAFTRANVRDLGGGDLRDILAGIDAAIALAPIDPTRLGITGVSYGGFMTMWSVTQTHRFRAAVARAGISDWMSYYGENGISDWLIPYFGSSAYDDPAAYARASAVNAMKAVRTPVLLMVGERDIECPPPQSMEFWHALRELNVPTSYVVYPGEGHEFQDPKHLADAEARAIAWFDQYLAREKR